MDEEDGWIDRDALAPGGVGYDYPRLNLPACTCWSKFTLALSQQVRCSCTFPV